MSSAIAIPSIHLPLITRRTRAYFAPVDRNSGSPTIFDPSSSYVWNLESPESPWIDLGWIDGFKRVSESKIAEVNTGALACARLQVRQSLSASVSFRFIVWSKLSMALASGSQHMNLLLPDPLAAPVASGARAKPPMALAQNSTATTLYVSPSTTPSVAAGNLIVVDEDSDGKTGFVGALISGAYLSAARGSVDSDYVRRISFNVGRIASVTSDGGLKLASPLMAGTPGLGMKIQQVVGFVDREGGTFFQEWSALFVREGVQGEKVFVHYPRLQVCQPQTESVVVVAADMEQVSLSANFRALSVVDPNDGEQVLCYRSVIPSCNAYV